MTIAAAYWPRRTRLLGVRSVRRRVRVDEGVHVVVIVDDPPTPARGTLVLVHGLTGSADAVYMRGTAEKALSLGLRTARVNLRGAGGTEVDAPTLYHSGMSNDLASVLMELGAEDPGPLYVVGFSLGGNLALKLAGEWGGQGPSNVLAFAAISPPLDLANCADALDRGGMNRIYQSRFVLRLKEEVRRRARIRPANLDLSRLDSVATVREFDGFFTAPYFGFVDAADYYARCSALPLSGGIERPTLIVSALDDTLVPSDPLLDPALRANSRVTVVLTQHGGHLGFVGARPGRWATGRRDLDRHWAENRVLEFFHRIHVESGGRETFSACPGSSDRAFP